MKHFLLFGLFLTSSMITSAASAAIFGRDDRQAITEHSSQASVARSTAVAVLSSNFSINPDGTIKLETDPLGDILCSAEKFSQDRSLSYACTGFLVGPDLIATAGHCMVNTGESRHETETYCKSFSWLFDYKSSANGTTQVDQIPANNLYNCKEVIYAVKDEGSPFRDYALVRLDRPVTDRTPYRFAANKVKEGESLFMIGHPLGSPLKLSSNAKVVLDNPKHESFITNLDALDGNSGSPVFNLANEIVGILVGGTPIDAFVDTNKGCAFYNKCDDDGKNCTIPEKNIALLPGFQRIGSEVQRVEKLKKLIDENQSSSGK